MDIFIDKVGFQVGSGERLFSGALTDHYNSFHERVLKIGLTGCDDANAIADKNDRLDSIEYSMSQGIDPELRHRFTPYLQLHEFEGLLFNDIDIFWNQIPREDLVDIEELKKTFSDYPNPEMINNNKETSPSHRLARIIRGYNKVIHGDIISEAIGLTRIRKKCPRFNAWITRLEKI